MRSVISLIILCSFLISSLTSCFDANEVESMAYVLTIGIDRGVSDKWRITVQFNKMQQEASQASPSSGGGGKKEGEGQDQQGGYASATIDCPSFYSGVNMLDTILPRRLNFMHTKYLIISEDLARSGELGIILAPLLRFRQIRRTVRLIVTKSTAQELIKVNEPYIGVLLSKSEEMMLFEQAFTNFTPNITLNNFYNAMKSAYSQPFAVLGSVNDFKNFGKTGPPESKESKSGGGYYAGQLPREGGDRKEFFGTALFDGDKMVGELSGDETRQMIIARGELKRTFFGIEDPLKPGLVVPLDIRQSNKPDIRVKIIKDQPVIDLKVFLEGEILAIQSDVKYDDPKFMRILEKAVESKGKENQQKLIEKCKSFNADVFGFGSFAASQFGRIQDWEKYNWKKKFANAQVNVEVKFKIVRSGTLLKTSPTISSGGSK